MIRRPAISWLLRTIAVGAALVQYAYGERLPVKIFTSADGLGSSFVNYVMRDSRGFLWFCTRDGLSRFDGSHFVTYQLGDKDPPSGIEAIYETRNGDYWVTTTAGTYRFHANVVSHPTQAGANGRPVLPADFVTPGRGVLFEDSRGQLWSGGWSLYRLHEQNGALSLDETAIHLPFPGKGSLVLQIDEAKDGTLWLGTTEGVAHVFPNDHVVFYRLLKEPDRSIATMILDAEERVWFTSGPNLVVFKPAASDLTDPGIGLTIRDLSQTKPTPANSGSPLRLPQAAGETLVLTGGDSLNEFAGQRLFQSADRHVWLTTAQELLEFDGITIRRYTVAQGLLPGMSRMTEDTAGNIWIGGRAGLVRLDRHSLSTYTDADGLRSTTLQAITQAQDGTVFFSTSDYYLNWFRGSQLVSERPNIPASSVARWSSRHAMVDRQGDLWVLTRTGLYRFAPNDLKHPRKVYTERDGLRSVAVFQIYEDRSGAIWVSQYPPEHPELRGLSRLAPGATTFYSFGEAEGFPPEQTVSSFAEDKAGNLWLGFYEGGLAHFAGGRFTTFSSVAGVPKSLVTDLFVDGAGRLWLSSGDGGCGRIDDPSALPPRIVNLTVNEGLSSNNVRTITGDSFGNVYLGTVRGVDRISADGRHFKHFSVSDGLASDFVVDSLTDRNGVIWFATTNGLSRLVPNVEALRDPPSIWLGGLRVVGVPQPVEELGQRAITTAELSHTQNSLQIDFFGLDFRAGDVLRYQYKLEGASGDWSAPSEQRTVTLANLQPGNYRFLVRAINSDGTVSTMPAEVRFRISPPFWLRWWFLALCGLAVIGVGVAVYSYRTARLRQVNAARAERIAELERVRNRIATDLHDDIGASLTQIAVLSEVAQAQNNGNGASAQPLKAISNVSNELVETMSDIVWSINPSKDRLSDLTQRMRRFASDLLTAKGIAIKFIAPDRELGIPLDTTLRREVFLIFKESVNNIVKHSGATQVQIDFTVSGKELHLAIQDNGHGFTLNPAGITAPDNGDKKGGNGLLSMQKRAREIRGELEFETKPGSGTKISLRLPLEQSGMA